MSDTLSKAQFARLLDASKSSISGLCRRGLPQTADGRIPQRTALEFLSRYTSGQGGGWGAWRRGKDGLAERAARILAGKPAAIEPAASEPEAEPETASFTLAEFRESWGKAHREGQVWTANQLRRPGNVAIIADLAAALGCDAAGAYGLAIWYAHMIRTWVCDDGDESTEYEYDFAPLAQRFGVPPNVKAWSKEIDRRIAAWDKALRADRIAAKRRAK